MRIISVSSGKGGVGKTTIAANLAALLAKKFGKDVMLVDCNITTSHLGLYLGVSHYPVSINHVIKGIAEVEDAIYNHPVGIKFMPASCSIKDLNGIDLSKMIDVIKSVKKKMDMDYVILDCAPGLGREAMAGLRSSSEMLLVTTPHTPAIVDMIKCKHFAEEFGIRPIGAVVNMSGYVRNELKSKDIENILGLPVLASVPMDKNVARSLIESKLTAIHKPRSKASKNMSKLAEKIVGIG
jgi:cell division ATPase MinD